jgi:chitodextrinase
MLDTAEEKERAQHRHWARMQPQEPEEPEPPCKLDIRPLTLADLDQRIGEWLAAEREYLHELLAQLLADMPTAERGERGPPGFLPIVKTWRHDAVYYAGDVVAFDGSTWQATKDTAQAPGTGGDWQLLARGGSDAFRPQVPGTHGAEKKYRCLDIVARDGSSFIARRDFPGVCPGEDWQLLAGAGRSGPQGPQGEKGESVVGPPGKLPAVKRWQPETVFYQGDVVASDGGMFQAARDTGQPPHHSDWICLARGGRDAKNFTVRGIYRSGERYQVLDIVSKNGGSFIARRDDPGECPGDGWTNLTLPGKRGAEGAVGPKGDKGDQGAKGDAEPTILEWVLDYDNYRAIPLMSDGSPAPVLELRGLFERFFDETAHGR